MKIENTLIFEWVAQQLLQGPFEWSVVCLHQHDAQQHKQHRIKNHRLQPIAYAKVADDKLISAVVHKLDHKDT
jgi:hypothetical protein